MGAVRYLGVMVAMLLMSVSALAQTQTNRVVTFTNQFATFTNLQGRLYANVELVRADLFSITYRNEAGGGRIYLTNLAPAVLEKLGLATNSAAIAAEFDAELARQKAESAAVEDERSRDPKNWKEVHVLEILREYGGGIECSVKEISRRVIIRGVPASLINYWNQRRNLQHTIAQLNAQIQQLRAQSQQLSAQIDAQRPHLEQRSRELAQLDAATPAYAYGDVDYVNAVMAARANINLAKENLNVDTEEFNKQVDQLNNLQQQLHDAQVQLETNNTALGDLELNGMKVRTLKVFIRSGTYLGIPILDSKTVDTEEAPIAKPVSTTGHRA
jgi:hypothetical protein